MEKLKNKRVTGVRHRKLEDGETEIILDLEGGTEFSVFAHRYSPSVSYEKPYRVPGFDFRIKPGHPLRLSYNPRNAQVAHLSGSHTEWLKVFAFCLSSDAGIREDETICVHAEIADECLACRGFESELGAYEKALEDQDEGMLYYLSTFGNRDDDEDYALKLHLEES